jgi:PEP-CTERM motif
MINTKFMTILGVVAALGLAESLNAQIAGGIAFGGNFTQNGGTSGNLATAISMSINTINIIAPSGAYAGAVNPILASPIGVNGNPPSLVGNSLWSVMVGATTYTFTVSSESQVFANSSLLNLAGNGTVSDGIPAHNTAGTWTLQFGVSGGTAFSYNETTTTTVPEPTTLALAGLSGLSLLLFRRQRK